MTEIEKGNILIAEFDGYKVELSPQGKHLIRYKNGKWAGQWNQNGEGKYNTSWDWLMPIVNKIRNLKIPNHYIETHLYNQSFAINVNNSQNGRQLFTFTSNYFYKDFSYLGIDIENVFKVVVKFIEWYNNDR